mmetsp:Transcript_39973/g.103160  ORF Transcript_39973/g.103160 Transcript_39973/m.103160 type:complete len:253 (+) Transcript_39973:3944-4702(+)
MIRVDAVVETEKRENSIVLRGSTFSFHRPTDVPAGIRPKTPGGIHPSSRRRSHPCWTMFAPNRIRLADIQESSFAEPAPRGYGLCLGTEIETKGDPFLFLSFLFVSFSFSYFLSIKRLCVSWVRDRRKETGRWSQKVTKKERQRYNKKKRSKRSTLTWVSFCFPQKRRQDRRETKEIEGNRLWCVGWVTMPHLSVGYKVWMSERIPQEPFLLLLLWVGWKLNKNKKCKKLVFLSHSFLSLVSIKKNRCPVIP